MFFLYIDPGTGSMLFSILIGVISTASTQNMFVFMQNPMPHHPAFLQYPDYTISQNVIFDEKNPLSHDANYHVNAASLILLGKWLRWLKENGVYDNTRIIISADHGSGAVKTDAKLEECQMFPAGGEQPLLLIKDFNSTGKLKTDETFMTNADVPSLAVKNVIENPVNPATGTDITSLSLKNPAVITLADWQETKTLLVTLIRRANFRARMIPGMPLTARYSMQKTGEIFLLNKHRKRLKGNYIHPLNNATKLSQGNNVKVLSKRLRNRKIYGRIIYGIKKLKEEKKQ